MLSLEISDAYNWYCIVYTASLWPLIGVYTRLPSRCFLLEEFGCFFPRFFTDNHTYTEIVPDDFVLVPLQLMCLADLEFDYINPFDSSSRINKVVMPEFILQALLSVLFLISGHWAMFLISAPMVYYNYTL